MQLKQNSKGMYKKIIEASIEMETPPYTLSNIL